MVTRDDGWVAVKQHQTIPHTVQVNKHEYAFVVKFNICLAWIHPDDVDAIMAIRKECCGGHKNPRYRFANELDVERWSK